MMIEFERYDLKPVVGLKIKNKNCSNDDFIRDKMICIILS